MEKAEEKDIKDTNNAKITESSIVKKDDEVMNIPDERNRNDITKSKHGWGSMLFNFFKALIFGACVFWYDIISKSHL